MDEVRKCVDPGRAHADREGPGLQPRHRAPAADTIRCEVLGEEATQADMATRYAEYFPQFIKHGIEAELLERGAGAVRPRRSSARRSKPERDLQFGYLGLQTLYDRYFLHSTRRTRASSCRRRSSCASRWAWR